MGNSLTPDALSHSTLLILGNLLVLNKQVRKRSQRDFNLIEILRQKALVKLKNMNPR
jgi:hypothetical protein